MRKSKGKHHTGPTHHSGMTNRLKGEGKDPHASSEHHAMNSQMGMPEGCCPTGGHQAPQEASEGMSDGESCEY